MTVNESLQNSKKVGNGAAVYLEHNFYKMADALRTQFDKQAASSPSEGDGMTSLTYAFCEDAYQFLTASADHIFGQDSLEEFTQKLGDWAKNTLGTTHISTPQVRVYVSGCCRELLQDNVSAKWHYVLSLTRSNRRHKTGRIKLMKSDGVGASNGRSLSLGRVVELELEFNQLLVHSTNDAYSVELAKNSMNPKDATIFLDGYLW